jgi:hypothetical protein
LIILIPDCFPGAGRPRTFYLFEFSKRRMPFRRPIVHRTGLRSGAMTMQESMVILARYLGSSGHQLFDWTSQ